MTPLRCLIVFFSQDGATSKVAESIASGLREMEFQVELFNLKDDVPPDPRTYDLVGIGTPIYYLRPTQNIMEYLNNLPTLNGLPVFSFITYGTLFGDTVRFINRVLERKNAKEQGFFYCYGPDYFVGYLRKGYLFSADHPTIEELGEAKEFGRKIAMGGYEASEDKGSLKWVYRLERFLTSPWLIRQLYSRLFKTTKSCITCGLCATKCPTKNILRDREGKPMWGRNCLLCLTCEMRCPKEAIISVLDWQVFRPFISYNVRGAIRNLPVGFAPVTHKMGQTERL